MTKSNKQVDLNKKSIRKNKRHIFELECQASTAYAESMLVIADIEENRALLSRNFSAAFNGNRAIAVDNIEDLYRCRMLMVDALEAKTDIEQNFKSAMANKLRIDLLENKFSLNEKLREVANQMSAVNELLVLLNKLVAESNEMLADQGAEMVSENAEWIDGEISSYQYENRINHIIQHGFVQTDPIQQDSIPDWMQMNAKKWIDGEINQKEYFDILKFIAS